MGVLLTWLASSSLVSAAPPRAQLTVDRPFQSMCPSARVLESDVEQLAGRSLFTDARSAATHLSVRYEHAGEVARAIIEARSNTGALLGTRVIEAPRGCLALRGPLGLVLLMVLEDERLEGETSAARARPLSLGAGIALLSGTLPRVTPGVTLALGLDAGRHLLGRVDASYWLPVSVETPGGVGARLQALGVAMALCPRLSRTSGVAVWLCGGAQLGTLFSSPRGLAGPRLQTRLLAQAVAELRGALPLSPRIQLEAGLGATLALSRPAYAYLRSDASVADVHRPALLGAIVRLAIIIDGS